MRAVPTSANVPVGDGRSSRAGKWASGRAFRTAGRFPVQASGDTTKDSDVDLVVRFEPGRSLFDQGGLLMDLRELLGVKVDVVSEGALSG